MILIHPFHQSIHKLICVFLCRMLGPRHLSTLKKGHGDDDDDDYNNDDRFYGGHVSEQQLWRAAGREACSDIWQLPSQICRRFRRRPELPYRAYHPDIAEFWSTVTNAGFVLGALVCWNILYGRLIVHGALDLWPFFAMRTQMLGPLDADTLGCLIMLQLAAGACSAVHHAQCDRHGSWTIFLDLLPIVISIVVFGTYMESFAACWAAVSDFSVGAILLALFILLQDHVLQIGPAPWGHCIWHVVASIAVTSTYLDLIFALHPM